jgi:cell division protein FtsI/penicillin-binding protein 2
MEEKKKNKSHFPVRLNILFFSVFVLFSILILRLGFVQIVYGDNFRRELDRKENITINNPVPRGKIYDRNYHVIVDNVPKSAITYTNSGAGQREMLETAQKLAKLIDKKTDKVTDRDKKDFWIIKKPKLADAKITQKERGLYSAKKLSERDLYKLKLDRISANDLKQLTNEDLEVLAIFREFSRGYKYSSQIVKNENVTPEEFAFVSENLPSMPGVDTTTDWERLYKFDKTLKAVIGNVTNYEEGLPREQLDYFLSRGYSRNDRVGKSYLELQYEDILHGYKSKVKNITENDGTVTETQVISDGQRGRDLVLSIDMTLQQSVEKILAEELWKAKAFPGTSLLDRAYVVLMDPHTGEVLTMAGKRLVRNKETGRLEVQDDSLGTFTTSYNVGSAVKGATILTGYKTGAIAPRTIFNDTGIKIKDTPIKKSWTYLGDVNDVEALKKSSNVYMFHTAIRIGGGHYEYDKPLNLKPEAFDIIRNSFASFGLGSRTGIDLPNEQVGFKGRSTLPGFLMDLVIGQYDTYSPLQLAQYISTIANGGYRMQPHLVKEIHEPLKASNELGPVFKQIKPNVMNTIDVKKEWMNRVQLGFKKVFQESGGTAYKYFEGVSYSPAGKTGTAQAFYDGPERPKFGKIPPSVYNLSLVGYAPNKNPKVAMAVLIPWAYEGEDENNYINFKIGRRVLDTYFTMKKK